VIADKGDAWNTASLGRSAPQLLLVVQGDLPVYLSVKRSSALAGAERAEACNIIRSVQLKNND